MRSGTKPGRSTDNPYFEHTAYVDGQPWQIIASGYQFEYRFQIINKFIQQQILPLAEKCAKTIAATDAANEVLNEFAETVNKLCAQNDEKCNLAIGLSFKNNNQLWYASCAFGHSTINHVALILDPENKNETLVDSSASNKTSIQSIIQIKEGDEIYGFTHSDKKTKKHIVIPVTEVRLRISDVQNQEMNLEELLFKLRYPDDNGYQKYVNNHLSLKVTPTVYNDIMRRKRRGANAGDLLTEVELCLDLINNPEEQNSRRIKELAWKYFPREIQTFKIYSDFLENCRYLQNSIRKPKRSQTNFLGAFETELPYIIIVSENDNQNTNVTDLVDNFIYPCLAQSHHALMGDHNPEEIMNTALNKITTECDNKKIYLNMSLGFAFEKDRRWYCAGGFIKRGKEGHTVLAIKEKKSEAEILTDTAKAQEIYNYFVREVHANDKIIGQTSSGESLIEIPTPEMLELKRRLARLKSYEHSDRRERYKNAKASPVEFCHVIVPDIVREILRCIDMGADIWELAEDTQLCIDMLDNPSEKNFKRLMASAERKQGKPSPWKQALGISLIFFGISLAILGLFMLTCGTTLLPTGLFTLPAAGGIAAGFSFIAGGAAIASFGGGMFHQGRRKGSSNCFARFAKICYEPTPRLK